MVKIGPYFIFILFVCSCNYQEEPTSLFTLLNPDETRVIFSNNLTDTEEFNIVEYLNYYNGAGVAAGDIDNDGFVDLYFASNQQSNKLFLNKGNFKFQDITKGAGVACPGDWKTGVTMADVNGDGFLDIYVSQVGDYKTVQGENHLYINNGDRTFSDRTAEFGLSFKGFSTHTLFFDYDNDGDLDMYLLNHAIHTRGSYGYAAIIRYTRDLKTGDRLFEQIEKGGKPYFVNVTERAGIYSSRIGYGLGIAAGDVNNDGCIDLYISNDFHENDYLYINNCDGTFTEKIRISIAHTSKSSMGNDMADFNNDGLLDIYTLDMLPDDNAILKNSATEEMHEVSDLKDQLGYHYQLSRNALQLNRGNTVFSEIAAFAGVYATDWSWAPLFFDADNDGYKDLLVTNGIPNRPNDLDYLKFIEDNATSINTTGADRISNATLVEIMPEDTVANFAFKNNGNLTFSNYSTAWGIDQKSFSNGSVYADLDNDGDLDFIANNLNENCFIYRNNAEKITNNSYLRVKLKGPEKNVFGIGAKVEIKIKGRLQVLQMMPSRGSMSSVDPILVFGLGSDTEIDSLIVSWPGGRLEVLKNIPVNQEIELIFDNARIPINQEKHAQIPLFVDYTDSIEGDFIHQESRFLDFNYQPLLPNKLSTLGPKMAIGDVNGDGLEDIYICAGSGQAGQLMLQQPTKNFTNKYQQSFSAHAGGEEVDAALFDIDGDKDMDLYIARGSSEHSNYPGLLVDLLYVNDGKGNFQSSYSFPQKTSISSCVSPCDFDNDGDIDLFIGSKPLLDQYGVPSENQLLENNGNGKFKDITSSIGKSFQRIGMVNDATWSDIDGDNLQDLELVGDWMNISIFKNTGDQFKDITSEAGLSNTTGWWNTIVPNDLDDDGDIDFIVGNLGLNTKIKASKDQPASLYAKDFDGNGIQDPIICFYKDDMSIPFATRDDLIAQIPSLKNRFPSYDSYAKVRSIDDLFSDNQLIDANIRYAQEFHSSIIENHGNGIFQVIPLPDEGQLFPVFSILVHDFDKDGIKDMIIGGNLSGSNINYGRYDAGYGLYLKGRGSLQFQPVSIVDSGIYLRGDTRDIKSIGNGLIFISKSDARMQIMKINNEQKKQSLR